MKKDFLVFLTASLVIFLGFMLVVGNKPQKPKDSSELSLACNTLDLSGNFDPFDTTAFFEGEEVSLPQLAALEGDIQVLGVGNEERWIEVDLSEQKLKAWEGSTLFLETPVSTGLPWTPTPRGEFRVWIKLRATKMEGGRGKYYYYLPNVPYVMFFQNSEVPGWRGYSLHGTYWHSDFGHPRSHGCVNLPTPIAKELYFWIGPILPDGKGMVRASAENPGTRVIIHD